MAIPLNLRDIQSGFLTAAAYTANNTLIEEAMQKALNREGGADNEMLADLDMGLNNIINAFDLDVKSITINGIDYETALQNIANAAQASADAASDSELAAAAAASEASAAASELVVEVIRQATSDLLDEFRGIYYGALSSEPALDPLGNPINDGDMYFNTTDGVLYIYGAGLWANLIEVTMNLHLAAPDPHPQYLIAEDSSDISYDNTSSGLAADNVQSAIDEVEGRLGTAESSLSGHLSSNTAHASDDITYDNTASGSSATDVKGAVDDIYSQIGDIATTLDEINGEVI